MEERPTVTGEIVKLDYATLRDTIYKDCKLVYAGGRPPTLIGCDFVECEFIMEGSAQNTQAFLQMLVHSGAADLVVNGLLGLKGWGPKNG